MLENKDRFIGFICCLIAGSALLGMSLGTIVTIAIMQNGTKSPYAFAFIVAFIGSLCFTFMPRPKRN